MFRKLTRKKQELTETECKELLIKLKRGVLSVCGDNGYPYGMPMNHYYNETDGCIYFHCGKNGHRTDAVSNSDKASFCVYDQGEKIEGDWALSVKSVIVFGKIEIISDINTVIDISARLCHKFTSDDNYIKNEIDNYASSTILLKLTPLHICGKRVKES